MSGAQAISSRQFGQQMRLALRMLVPAKIGIAVSGGVDSMALAFLANRYFANYNTEIYTFTVNHRLRQGSFEEAQTVTANLKNIGINNHQILTIAWPNGQPPRHNFELEARNKRRELLLEACKTRSISSLLMAHTLDDQMETFLLRLLKGSSIHGLAGMRPVSSFSEYVTPDSAEYDPAPRVVRPLLNLPKSALTSTCVENGVSWVEDSTNRDPTFTPRNSIRKLLSDPRELPRALTPDSLEHTLDIIQNTRNGIEREFRQTLDYMTFHRLICVDPVLGMARITEFDGFRDLRVSVRTLIFAEILRRVSPLSDLDYRYSAIDWAVRRIPSGPVESVTAVNACLTTINIIPSRKPTVGESAHPPQVYLVARQRIPRQKAGSKLVMRLQTSWSEWTLFDNRLWIRCKYSGASPPPRNAISVRLLFSVRDAKPVLAEHLGLSEQHRWPKVSYMVSQPLFMFHDDKHPDDITPDNIIGLPTLGLTNPTKSKVDIECQLKQVVDNLIPEASIYP